MKIEYIGLMHFNMVPNYFSNEYRKEYGGLYGIRLQPEDMENIEEYRMDREEIEKVALLKDIGAEEKMAEIDRELLHYFR